VAAAVHSRFDHRTGKGRCDKKRPESAFRSFEAVLHHPWLSADAFKVAGGHVPAVAAIGAHNAAAGVNYVVTAGFLVGFIVLWLLVLILVFHGSISS
jgi:hypothetical protein